LISDGTSQFDVIAFGDLNDFKHLNDSYGHAAGDVAINKVGEVIHKFIVEDLKGKAFRQSGDEFVLLLEQNRVDGLRSASDFMSNIAFSYNRNALITSLSLGYVISDGKSSFEDLIQRAEAACQIAKAKVEAVCVEWTNDIEYNPVVRLTGRCRECGARISCNVPKNNAPDTILSCPCCGKSL
jgi:diguanylate cyclase (GGDEF)-like protein